MRQPRQGAQVIRRALAILRTLAVGRESGVALAEVVRATGLTRPTTHRIIHILVEEGIVERQARTGFYAIGGQVPELALARPSRAALLIAGEPFLAEVSQKIGDTLFLTVRTGLDTLCVARRIGAFPIQVFSIEVGARRPLGVSSAGVAILAVLSSRDARQIVSTNRARFTPYRTDSQAVLAQVRSARTRGYSLRDIGLVQGTRSMSVCIKEPDGQPAGAITVSALRSRIGPRRESEMAETLLTAAKSIESRLAQMREVVRTSAL